MATNATQQAQREVSEILFHISWPKLCFSLLVGFTTVVRIYFLKKRQTLLFTQKTHFPAY